MEYRGRDKTDSKIVVPREQAVFWLDKDGNWQNDGGRFELKKIIRKFHKSIQKDANGFFLTQMNGNRREKVYFPYEDTALFAIDVELKGELSIRLNTGKRLPFHPDRLYCNLDSLYTVIDDDWIKFAERSLLKLSSRIDYESDPWLFRYEGKAFPIRKKGEPG